MIQGNSRINSLILISLILLSATACSVAPCASGPSLKETFELKSQCNQLGTELDKNFAGQWANFDLDDKFDLTHHVFLSHYNQKRNTCYVFMNHTHPDHMIGYLVDATTNQELLQATTDTSTNKTIYRWYDSSNTGWFFHVSREQYVAKFDELMEPPPNH